MRKFLIAGLVLAPLMTHAHEVHADQWARTASLRLSAGMTFQSATSMSSHYTDFGVRTCGVALGSAWQCRYIAYHDGSEALVLAFAQSRAGIWYLTDWRVVND